jgi:NAD-dependent dihydropyrimidine dehydrogenase PreA subunit
VKLPTVEIIADQCKGCALCIEVCPKKVLELGKNFNVLGYQPVELVAEGCTGCAACFYACPEPGTITVVKEKKVAV